MTGILWGALGVLGGLGMTAIGDMVSEEVRDRLDHLPHSILRLAARRLDPTQRATIYEDEWLPELTYILKGDEARPVTRLIHGVRYALGILVAVRRITRQLSRPLLGPPKPMIAVEGITDQRVLTALASIGAGVVEWRRLVAELCAREQSLEATAEQLRCLRYSRARVIGWICTHAKLQWRLRGTRRRLAVLYSERDRAEQIVGGSLTKFLSRIEAEAGSLVLQEAESAMALATASRAKSKFRFGFSARQPGPASRRPRT